MSWFRDLLLKMAANKAAKALNLQEGTAMDTKKWYQSKGVWTGIFTVLFGAYDLVGAALAPQFGWHLPVIPEYVFLILGALGIYSRAAATTVIER